MVTARVAIVTDLLRNKYGFDGVVCTDWLIIAKEPSTPGSFAGKPWGVEDLDLPQLHYKALEAGVDQFGGNNMVAPKDARTAKYKRQ